MWICFRSMLPKVQLTNQTLFFFFLCHFQLDWILLQLPSAFPWPSTRLVSFSINLSIYLSIYLSLSFFLLFSLSNKIVDAEFLNELNYGSNHHRLATVLINHTATLALPRTANLNNLKIVTVLQTRTSVLHVLQRTIQGVFVPFTSVTFHSDDDETSKWMHARTYHVANCVGSPPLPPPLPPHTLIIVL